MVYVDYGDQITYESHTLLYKEPKPRIVYLKPGYYIFECWGAQGGYRDLPESGKGAYTYGEIKIHYGRHFYLYVGQKGSINSDGGYNGGGKGGCFITDDWVGDSYGGSGGGASDIRLVYNDDCLDPTSLKSRIMVAAGGGGCINYLSNEVEGTCGGALQADAAKFSECTNCDNPDNYVYASGGTQDSGGSTPTSNSGPGGFGYGGESQILFGGGGGSGYFGGASGAGVTHRYGAGAGGSSFVSGYDGCHAFASKDADKPSTSSIHYSGIVFINPKINSGSEQFLSPEGKQETGHKGDGAIKITLIERYYYMTNCQSLLNAINLYPYIIHFFLVNS